MGHAVAVEIPFAFREAMTRLMGLRFAPASLQTHWEGLSDVKHAELEAAITRAQRECDDFPSPRQLRAFIDQARSRPQLEPLEDRTIAVQPTTIEVPQIGVSIPVLREWRYYCQDCRDTGYRALWCGPDRDPALFLGRTVGRCGVAKEHCSHEFVVACTCATSNPDVQRKRARERQTVRSTVER